MGSVQNLAGEDIVAMLVASLWNIRPHCPR